MCAEAGWLLILCGEYQVEELEGLAHSFSTFKCTPYVHAQTYRSVSAFTPRACRYWRPLGDVLASHSLTTATSNKKTKIIIMQKIPESGV
ncbi:predicted protein [Sclerotinia sclerotiorum 1980 UF-70]|uniref:Uncharacterized protein n=1 Tax=Sclerotinia sclerotiorum (strain ATCC 18683 / 1980 / Ss-1) TaxID=665079 RepID=A7EB03_SCLS1|nr:predicted protein [Sclerotinia sclerotiorum 1980 UF-70]EDN99631.1 predicted protein [Sclerotinia sclerotiorum 1980 UF-70]